MYNWRQLVRTLNVTQLNVKRDATRENTESLAFSLYKGIYFDFFKADYTKLSSGITHVLQDETNYQIRTMNEEKCTTDDNSWEG